MSGETNSDFSRAIASLTIFQLWREAGFAAAPGKDGVYKSPFREERSASFSVLGGGRGFKDFGTGAKGGVIDFAVLAFPNKTKDEIRDLMIDLAGTRSVPLPPQQRETLERAAAVAAAIDPSVLKAAKTIERNRQLREAERAIYDDREEQLEVYVSDRKANVPAWPEIVAGRYQEGVDNLVGDRKRQAALAEDRGWPLFWVEELLPLGLLSYPFERWTEPGLKYARRQKAFRVDFPVFNEVGGLSVELRPVGYHQRFFMPARPGETERKGWLYVPSFPKSNTRSDFETAIVQCGIERGLQPPDETHKGEGFFPPLPFVMGDVANAKTIVLLEGQWDAITFFGACGYFNDTSTPDGVAVFGIRGAQGMDVFLGYWGAWLRDRKPLAWVIADNDEAGRSWREAPAAEDGKLRPPSLAEKLAAAGCRRVLVSWLEGGRWGKDFNDFYRAAKPGPAAMFKWMNAEGVLDTAGGWA